MERSLKPHLVNGGRLENDGQRVRLWIPSTSGDAYTDAQLDDYDHALPRTFRNVPPLQVHVRLRFSHDAHQLKGTAGIGFWNHPFARDGRVLLPPCAVWFFFCSSESNLRLTPRSVGHGFVAMALDAHAPAPAHNRLTRMLVGAGNLALRLPPTRQLAIWAAQRLVRAAEAPLNHLSLTAWHDYRIHWERSCAQFWVDDVLVLSAPAPHQPLGFVAWVDNYRAAASPEAPYGFRFVPTEQPQWMEIEWCPDSDLRLMLTYDSL